jgi:FkbM family methyltransferase
MKEVVYKILDVFTGNKGLRKTINGFSVKLPTRYINYFPSDYEQENFEFLKQHVKKGDHVLDIGAHIGLFSTIAAQLTGHKGKVYAFEPAAETNALLKQTISINRMENIIEPYSEAMGAASGKTTFYVSAVKGDNSNSLVSYKEDRELYAMDVDMFSIDDFVKNKNLTSIAFIKIDVEGAEYDALCGAMNTLQHLRPVCIVAIHPEPIAAKGDSLEKIYDLIAGNNYKIYYEAKIISKEIFCSNRDLIDLHILPN